MVVNKPLYIFLEKKNIKKKVKENERKSLHNLLAEKSDQQNSLMDNLFTPSRVCINQGNMLHIHISISQEEASMLELRPRRRADPRGPHHNPIFPRLLPLFFENPRSPQVVALEKITLTWQKQTSGPVLTLTFKALLTSNFI